MRKFLGLLFGCLFFISPIVVQAMQPPPRKTLEERVRLATHVVIGTAKKVTVVETKGGKIEEVNPAPKTLAPNQAALIEIEVEETLYPVSWKPKSVKYLFGGGFFSFESIRGDTLDKKCIYLMTINSYLSENNESEFFNPSYEWHLSESLEARPQIQRVLNERIQRESPTKEQNPPVAQSRLP